jgi:proteasome lid subunit RPN8/RPN11
MLTVSPAVYDAIVDHVREGVPREVCGILGGEYGAETSHAVTVRRAENVANTPRTAYRIDPAEQLELMEAIEQAGRAVVGFYHSHPDGPSQPSGTDVARATWRGYSYLIAARAEGDLHLDSWRWTGERFVREEFRCE